MALLQTKFILAACRTTELQSGKDPKNLAKFLLCHIINEAQKSMQLLALKTSKVIISQDLSRVQPLYPWWWPAPMVVPKDPNLTHTMLGPFPHHTKTDLCDPHSNKDRSFP